MLPSQRAIAFTYWLVLIGGTMFVLGVMAGGHAAMSGLLKAVWRA